MPKQAIDWATSQCNRKVRSLRELTTHFRNLSVYCKPLNNALTYPSCVDIWNRKSVRRTGNDNELTLVDGEWVAKYSVQTQSHRHNVARCFCSETENDQLIDLSIYLSIIAAAFTFYAYALRELCRWMLLSNGEGKGLTYMVWRYANVLIFTDKLRPILYM